LFSGAIIIDGRQLYERFQVTLLSLVFGDFPVKLAGKLLPVSKESGVLLSQLL
jgi:hypothetical protein